MIGFMQGRLSPPVNGRIQAFPWEHWREEFTVAHEAGFGLMEWTLDVERLYDNPVMTAEGRVQIEQLKACHGVRIDSLTGDFFMHAPFHKTAGDERARRLRDLYAVCEACFQAKIRILVIPLVDAGRIESADEEHDVLRAFHALERDLEKLGILIALESDYAPRALARFVAELGPAFGINYDIGNSASLGYDPAQEINAYSARIRNVHVKDRLRGGATVPLGTGSADFEAVFAALAAARYSGNYILQTARAADDDHRGALERYRTMTERWVAEAPRAT